MDPAQFIFTEDKVGNRKDLFDPMRSTITTGKKNDTFVLNRGQSLDAPRNQYNMDGSNSIMYNKRFDGKRLPPYAEFLNFTRTRQAHWNHDYIRDKAAKVLNQDPHRRKYAVPRKEDHAPHASKYITNNYSLSRTREDQLNYTVTPVKNDQNLMLKTMDVPLGLTLKKGDLSAEGNNYESYDKKHWNTLTLKKNSERRNTICDMNHQSTVSKRKTSSEFNIYNKRGLRNIKRNAKKIFDSTYGQKLTKSSAL